MNRQLEDNENWITIDPGETVGFAKWTGTNLVHAGQMAQHEFMDDLWRDCNNIKPAVIVCEDWALYPWAMANHGMDFDPCRTARAIGAIAFIARHTHTALVLQSAQIKEAATMAGAGNLFITPLYPNRHANDAIMHGVFYLAQQGVRVP